MRIENPSRSAQLESHGGARPRKYTSGFGPNSAYHCTAANPAAQRVRRQIQADTNMNYPEPRKQPGRICALLLGVALALVGCKPRTAYEFDALDFTPTQDELGEFSMGHYDIPIPLAADGTVESESRNRVIISFDLFALVAPQDESQMKDSWQRHEGNVRDSVIRVCRSASPEELQEPELVTLKSHLADSVQEEMGNKSVHRLLLSEVTTKEL
jgi:hypothetical protein